MKAVLLPATLFLVLGVLAAQTAAPDTSKPADNISGMYSFLKDGEFVQVTVEDQGSVTGFISRYGDSDSDRGAFLNQFFKSGKLDGNKLSFTTEVVHAVSFDFNGTVERAQGKNEGEEGYHVLRGTLTENHIDANKKTSQTSRELIMKSFPRDLEGAPAKRD
jgi:hypothetical protein